MTAYLLDPNPVDTGNNAAYISLLKIEKSTLQHLGAYLDDTFKAVWSPPAPATVQGVVDLCGTTFLPRCILHSQIGALILAQEAANGIDSSTHPWAIPQPDGTFQPGIPVGKIVTPIIGADGKPTGAATISDVPAPTPPVDPPAPVDPPVPAPAPDPAPQPDPAPAP